MEIENKKKTSSLLIVVLILLGACLLGAGAWYVLNYFKDKESDKPVEDVSSKITSVGERIDFPQKSDDSVVIGKLSEFLTEDKMKTDFKNLKFTKNNNKLILNCEHYVNKSSSCGEVKVTINEEFALNIDTGYSNSLNGIDDPTYSGYDTAKTYNIFKVNNYYIIYKNGFIGLDLNRITIYRENNEIYTNDLIKTGYSYALDGNSYINTVPTIVNNTLYFIQQNENYDIDRAQYKSIDLSKDKIEEKLIKEFTGYISGEK